MIDRIRSQFRGKVGRPVPRFAAVRDLIWFWRYIRPHWVPYLVTVTALFLQTGIGLVQPLYYKILVDDVLNTSAPRGDLHLFIWILAVLGGLRVASIAVAMVSEILTTRISLNASNALESDLFRKLNMLPMRYHDRHAPGEIFPRLYNDPPSIIGFFLGSFPNIVTSLVKAIVVFGIILFMIWWAGIIAILPAIPIYFISRLNTKYFKSLSDRMFAKQQDLYTRVIDILNGIRIVRIFNKADYEIRRFNTLQRDVFDLKMEATYRSTWMSPLIGTIGKLGGGVIFIVGACRLLNFVSWGSASITLGSLFMLLSYVWQLAAPISNLANFSSELGNLQAASRRVKELLDEKPVERSTADLSVHAVGPIIEFRNVEFEYEAGKPVLTNLNLSIQPGELVGLVGPSGSGKTTILNLICGFYDPTRGSVHIHGIAPNDAILMSRSTPLIGLAMQDGALLQGSIRENMRYARPNAADEEIWEALKMVEAFDFVSNLPRGLDTRVGEGSNFFSSGQMQRLAMARAWMAKSEILILDEATSWVDLWTEQRIFRRLLRSRSDQTIVCISHRLHLMQLMDRIIVLRNGEIASEGTHAQLLDSDSFYAATWNLRDVDGYDGYEAERQE